MGDRIILIGSHPEDMIRMTLQITKRTSGFSIFRRVENKI